MSGACPQGKPDLLHSLSSGLQVESSAGLSVCDLRQHVCSCVSSSEDRQRRGYRDSTYRVHTKREEGTERRKERGGCVTAGLTHKCIFKILFICVYYIYIYKVFCLHVSVHVHAVFLVTRRGHWISRTGVQRLMCSHVGAGSRTHALCNSSQCS